MIVPVPFVTPDTATWPKAKGNVLTEQALVIKAVTGIDAVWVKAHADPELRTQAKAAALMK